ncbi:cupin domain-containing protein [Chitinophaga agrisoli]|nr:cupin domain-containing protein [Chitinophaga agrisoli]
MQTFSKWLYAGLAVLGGGQASAQSQTPAGILRKTLLEQQLPATTVETVRMDGLTLGPGAGAPDHYHPCEVYGYVVEGQILYQVHGQEPVLLHAGDSFREAAGERITVFKNALTDKPSKFIAIYLAKKGQSLIKFTDQ